MTIDIKSVSTDTVGSTKMNMTESSPNIELNMVKDETEHFHGPSLMEVETDEIMEASQSEKP